MSDQQRHYEDKLAYEIDSWDLHVGLTERQPITVIDARSPEAFAAERIPGAINIPHREMSEAATQQVDRNTLVVTYCDGIGGTFPGKRAGAVQKESAAKGIAVPVVLAEKLRVLAQEKGVPVPF